MQWVATIDGEPTSMVFYGQMTETLTPGVFLTNGVDFQGQPWSATLFVENAPSPITLDLVVNLNLGAHWNSNTPVPGWDGHYPFTSQVGDLLDPSSVGVGSWFAELFSASP